MADVSHATATTHAAADAAHASTSFFGSVDFWLIASFLGLLFVLYRYAAKPVLAALDAKAADIRRHIDEAAKLHKEASDLLADYRARHKNAMQEVQQITRDAQTLAEGLKARARDDMTRMTTQKKTQLESKIESLKQQAALDLRQNIAASVQSAAAHILAKAGKAEWRDAYDKQALQDLQAVAK